MKIWVHPRVTAKRPEITAEDAAEAFVGALTSRRIPFSVSGSGWTVRGGCCSSSPSRKHLVRGACFTQWVRRRACFES